MSFDLPPIDDLVARALAEDLGVATERVLTARGDSSLLMRDATSSALALPDPFCGAIVAREAGVVCGLPVAARAFEMLAEASGTNVECFPRVAEGADVRAGERVLEVEGDARAVLAAERTALNLLMVLSGIASEARRWQRAAGDAIAVTDTRKTLPGLRALSKYAVRVGGAYNHRAGLFDMVLIKDNHIVAFGSVTDAVRQEKAAHPGLLVECEAESVSQAAEAAGAGADYVLLDNMDEDTLARAVVAVREAAQGRACLTEASGGITFDRLSALAAAGIDRVSTSALTFAPPLDFGLDAERRK
ncbi:MAG: carboxylating nicotinate-nucleotide diphosphorylase [Actinobacteria bacterium]|nr:carboxylating nicotinate-nucleotide diphosphorylase [Actinomycetota bacterium]